jgi:hypothetical protein
MKNLQKLKLEALINRLSESAIELIQLGDSHEKSKGNGMLDVITQLSQLIGYKENRLKYTLFRQIRFFVWYYNQPGTKKVNLYYYFYNLLDRYIGFDCHMWVNFTNYYLPIYTMVNNIKRLEDFDIVAMDIVNLLNKKENEF